MSLSSPTDTLGMLVYTYIHTQCIIVFHILLDLNFFHYKNIPSLFPGDSLHYLSCPLSPMLSSQTTPYTVSSFSFRYQSNVNFSEILALTSPSRVVFLLLFPFQPMTRSKLYYLALFYFLHST